VDIRSSVSKPGIKSISCLPSLAYTSRLKNWASWRGIFIYIYLGGTPSISELWAPSLATAEGGSIPGGGGARSGGGGPVSLRLQRVWWFLDVPCWQGRQPSVWFSWTIDGWWSIAAFTFLCPGHSSSHFFSSPTSAWGFLIKCYVSSIAACDNPSLAILAIFDAMHMLNCSGITEPPCLAIVADMLKYYQK